MYTQDNRRRLLPVKIRKSHWRDFVYITQLESCDTVIQSLPDQISSLVYLIHTSHGDTLFFFSFFVNPCADSRP